MQNNDRTNSSLQKAIFFHRVNTQHLWFRAWMHYSMMFIFMFTIGCVRPVLAEEPIRVAIYDATRDGGKSFGSEGMLLSLKNQKDLHAEIITDLNLENLLTYHVLILGDIAKIGKSAPNDWCANVISYVNSGGGIFLTFDSLGLRREIKTSIFPSICYGTQRCEITSINQINPHPITTDIKPFYTSYYEYIGAAKGVNGDVLLADAEGNAAVVAGKYGKGKVLASGIILGISPSALEEEIKNENELKLLLNGIRWLNGKPNNEILIKSSSDKENYTQLEPVKLMLNIMKLPEKYSNRTIKIKSECFSFSGQKMSEKFWEIPAKQGCYQTSFACDPNIEDGKYYIHSTLTSINKETLISLDNAFKFAGQLNEMSWKLLPKANFEWCGLYCFPSTAYYGDNEKVKKNITLYKKMGFNTLLFCVKPWGNLTYASKIERNCLKEGEFDQFQAVISEAHKQGIKVYAEFSLFIDSYSALSRSNFLKTHPEYLYKMTGEKKYLKVDSHMGHPWLCPDRPEVRAYILSLMKEVLSNYDADGISLDYIRYKDDYACACEYSNQKRNEFAIAHPNGNTMQEFSEHQIVTFVESVKKLMDSINPNLKLHAYTHPGYANKFPLDYHAKRASSKSDVNNWYPEKIEPEAKSLVGSAQKHYKYTMAVPMIDIGLKNADRVRTEIRLVGKSGAKGITVYMDHFLFQTYSGKPVWRAFEEEFHH